MKAVAARLESTGLHSWARLFRAALRRFTWRTLAVAIAIAGALQIWNMIETELLIYTGADVVRAHLSRWLITLLMAFSTLVAVLVADEAVERGARRILAYGWAIMAASAAAAAAQAPVHAWLGVPFVFENIRGNELAQVIIVFFQHPLWASVIVLVYVNRRTAMQAAARMNAAQIERSRVRRNALESRLQALQARIEPRFLSSTLMQVRELYRVDTGRGRKMLDDLIVYLRAALPQMRETGSTLERELRLASAYLGIRLAHAPREAFHISADPRLLEAAVPPMMLVPLLEGLLPGAPHHADGESIDIRATRGGDDLQLVVHHRGMQVANQSTGSLLGDLADRLQMLYGARSSVTFEPTDDGTRVSLRVPYDPPDRDHR